jgi:urease subunit alpha
MSRIALADTGLALSVDDPAPQDEFRTGFGKTARDGMHLRASTAAETCDVVVSNVTVVDPVLGIRRASIGIRAGRISGIGKAGNPDTVDDVEVIVGTGSTIVAGDGLIATPGAIDTHVHLLSPRVLEAELASGVTTVIGQELGPVWGVGINSQWLLRRAFAAFDAWPVNVGFLARGSSADPAPLIEGLFGGACGFKVHEDLGAHPRCLDTALTVAGEHDVQVALHTDGLNEAGCLADTLAVADGRVFHAFHVEGCGGGHAPNVLELAGRADIITSSTNPTLPFGRDALAEHLDMIALVHGLDTSRPEQRRLALDRCREGTMSAEGPLHDLGIIPITSSDAQGMGRAGETIRRTFAMAALLRPQEDSDDDNERVLRYLAKLTINPAIAHGLAAEVGSLEPGKLADVVLWEPAFFGAKPYLVLKAGVAAWGATGDPNAVIESAQPLVSGPQFGGCGAAPAEISVAFVAQAALDARLPTARRRVAVCGTRSVTAGAMVRHGRTGTVRVDPRTGRTTLDGAPLAAPPADAVPLSRLYFL